MPIPTVIVHGGAGHYADGRLAEARLGCERAAAIAAELLARGASALDAVWADCAAAGLAPAGGHFQHARRLRRRRGFFLTCPGYPKCRNLKPVSKDEGEKLKAGAVACIDSVRNPILAARQVMEHGRHVLLVGPGATRFAHERGIAPYPTESLITPRARERWKLGEPLSKHGTVGAVGMGLAMLGLVFRRKR